MNSKGGLKILGVSIFIFLVTAAFVATAGMGSTFLNMFDFSEPLNLIVMFFMFLIVFLVPES